VTMHLADPVDHTPLHPAEGGLRSEAGRFYPARDGGYDLRPGAGDDNKTLQADIYDAKLGEFTDFEHPHNLMLLRERALLDALPLVAGDRVLEIGGHRSGALAYLEKRFGIVGSGLDIAPVWVRAQNRAAEARHSETRWVLGDAEHLPFADATFSAAVAFDVLEHVTHLDLAVAGLFRVLRPGGTLVAHLPVRDIEKSFDGLQRWRDPADYAARQATAGHFHERLPTRAQMRTLLEHKGFQVVATESFNVWIQPLHDHRLMPMLGKLRHLRRKAPAPAGMAEDAPKHEASAFQKAYATVALPLARALAVPDKVGSLLGIGGSCFFVAKRPG
jgi:ubiquinone/menaquinone biosynthesis C-methylase UbiE